MQACASRAVGGALLAAASTVRPPLRLCGTSAAAALLRRPAARRSPSRRQQRSALVRAEAAAAAAVPAPDEGQPGAAAAALQQQQQQHAVHRHRHVKTSLAWLAGGVAVAALLGAAHLAVARRAALLPMLAVLRAAVAGSPLAQSGFFAAFSLIFLSEVGDKTFFIAALLAMRLGKWASWWGSTIALAAMTVISVGIGAVVKAVPATLEQSEAIGRWLGAALLLYFGVRTLQDAWAQPVDSGTGDELEEAEQSVSDAEAGGKLGGSQTPLQALLEVASLIFVAEWGDRSMLATIALGAAQSPLGVAGGAVLAHGVATLIAVVGGAALSEHISERAVGLIGGTLFLVFAAATVMGLF